MAFDDFLNHRCDIYHIKRTDKSPGYQLPASPTFAYLETPDLVAVPCHFGSKGTATVVQAEPQAKYEARTKLAIPLGTDVRLNDKIIDCDSGYEYTSEIPRIVRDNHTVVYVHRTASQEAL